MKTLQKTLEIGKTIATWMLAALSFVAFMVIIFFAGGGPAIFAKTDTTCSGEQWVSVSKGDTIDSLALHHFPDERLDHNIVAGSIQDLNGTRSLEGTNNAKIPQECHVSP